MSFVNVLPEVLGLAATELAGVNSTLGAANAAAILARLVAGERVAGTA